MNKIVEFRRYGVVDMRSDAAQPVIAGYASVFDVVYDVGWFTEVIRAGAFKKTLQENNDVVSLLNHDMNFVIARTGNKTLTLREDAKGLYTESTPSDTTWEQDLLKKIKRGDQREMSFAFQTVKDVWGTDNGKAFREVLEVRLLDVSIVTSGANHATGASVRSLIGNVGLDEILLRAQSGQMRAEDKELLKQTIEMLKRFVPNQEPGNHSGVNNGGASQVRSLATYRRRLELAERQLNPHIYFGGK